MPHKLSWMISPFGQPQNWLKKLVSISCKIFAKYRETSDLFHKNCQSKALDISLFVRHTKKNLLLEIVGEINCSIFSLYERHTLLQMAEAWLN